MYLWSVVLFRFGADSIMLRSEMSGISRREYMIYLYKKRIITIILYSFIYCYTKIISLVNIFRDNATLLFVFADFT
jgi:hypothetical protein